MSESAEYVREWARRIASCGKKTLREAHEVYLQHARDPEKTEADRRWHRRRARALALWLEKPKPRFRS